MIQWMAVLAVFTATFHVAAQSRGPRLLVLSKQTNSLAIVDPLTRQVLGSVSTGEGPHELAASPDGKLAFVGNYGTREPGNTISIIDLEARKELRRFDLGPLRRPHGMALAQGKLYFTAEVNKLIARYDPASDQIDWLLGTGQDTTHMILVSKDANRIFTANIGSNSISLFEHLVEPAGWRQTVIPVGKGPEGLDLSPDGRELWTAQSRDGGVSIIDPWTKKVLQTIDLHTKRSNRLRFLPNSKLVLISDLDGGELIVLDAVTRDVIKRIKAGRSPEGILPAPDGTVAYVAIAGEDHVAIFDPAKLEIVGHIDIAGSPDGMAWSQ